ncbi:MAG: S1 family peptidase [Planctomycetota bacterium]|jgi:S1-C subfamily serine protease
MNKIKSYLTLAAILLLAGSFGFAQETKSVPKLLQDISVTISAKYGTGSGVLFTRTNHAGQTINLVWTAGHVVDDLRTTREVITADGAKRMIIEFADAKIVKQLIEDGRLVGRLEIDAEVIRYSNANNGEDLALLRVRKKNFVEATAVFKLDRITPELGTEMYHVGSLLGQIGANSLTSGIYSQHGRLIGKTLYDQTTCAAFPGSSGGGVFLKNGQYVGMVVRGAGETFNLIVPIRRIQDWAKRAKIEWAIDPSVPMPSEDDLKLLPVEDVGRKFTKLGSKPKDAKALFRWNDEATEITHGDFFHR